MGRKKWRNQIPTPGPRIALAKFVELVCTIRQVNKTSFSAVLFQANMNYVRFGDLAKYKANAKVEANAQN